MAIYLKQFSTHQEYETYIASEDKVLPNVSICEDTKDVHYNPYVPPETRVVAKYNVTDTSNPTPIGYNQYTSGFSEIEIDGVVQQSVVSAYTFGTIGEHTVKYTLTDPTSIGSSAFYRCSGLTSITIPDSVTNIGNGAFSVCKNLVSVTIGGGVTAIGSNTFNQCYSLTSITIPDSVTHIGSNAFYYCSGLTSIDISDSVTSIGDSAFSWCTGLTSVTIPSGVTSIEREVFGYCSGLTSITIPNSVTSIGYRAFYSCTSLTNITSNATTAPTIEKTTFMNIKTNGTLTVPQGSSGYDIWMMNADYYLGLYNWTKVEQ